MWGERVEEIATQRRKGAGGGDKSQELRDSFDKAFFFLCDVTDFTTHSANGARAVESVTMPVYRENTSQLLNRRNCSP